MTRSFNRTMICLAPGEDPGSHNDMEAARGEMEKSQFLRETFRQARLLGLPDFNAEARSQRLVRLPEELAGKLDRLRGRVKLDQFLAELVEQAVAKGLPKF